MVKVEQYDTYFEAKADLDNMFDASTNTLTLHVHLYRYENKLSYDVILPTNGVISGEQAILPISLAKYVKNTLDAITDKSQAPPELTDILDKINIDTHIFNIKESFTKDMIDISQISWERRQEIEDKYGCTLEEYIDKTVRDKHSLTDKEIIQFEDCY